MKSINKTIWTAAGLLGLVAIFALPAAADQQILDDLIVDGSACVGFDCVNGESFGFDTIRMKENNIRLHFQDTSTSASFPSNDWRLVANDSSNGGGNYLGIEDSSAGRIPFRVVAGAPAHSLYVQSNGRIGIGTSTPVVELHVVNGNTPTLRLEQNGSSGFTPQTWDVAGNEANFFVRDATNGSKLVFRAKPGAPDASIYIDADGDVGLETTSPDEELHVRSSEGSATRILIENANATATAAQLDFKNTANTAQLWRMGVAGDGRFIIRNNTGTENILILDETTNQATFFGDVVTGGTGTCAPPNPVCDGVFDPEVYTVESIEDHAAYMWANQHLKGVGPTLVGKPINVPQKTTGMLHELEKAHIYIEQLHDRLAKVEALLAATQAEKVD